MRRRDFPAVIQRILVDLGNTASRKSTCASCDDCNALAWRLDKNFALLLLEGTANLRFSTEC